MDRVLRNLVGRAASLALQAVNVVVSADEYQPAACIARNEIWPVQDLLNDLIAEAEPLVRLESLTLLKVEETEVPALRGDCNLRHRWQQLDECHIALDTCQTCDVVWRETQLQYARLCFILQRLHGDLAVLRPTFFVEAQPNGELLLVLIDARAGDLIFLPVVSVDEFDLSRLHVFATYGPEIARLSQHNEALEFSHIIDLNDLFLASDFGKIKLGYQIRFVRANLVDVQHRSCSEIHDHSDWQLGFRKRLRAVLVLGPVSLANAQ